MIGQQTITKTIEQYFNLVEGSLVSRNRSKRTAMARKTAMVLLYDVGQYSYSEIADILFRDPSTVRQNIYSLRKKEESKEIRHCKERLRRAAR